MKHFLIIQRTVMSDLEQGELEEVDHVSDIETLAGDEDQVLATEDGDWRFLDLPNEIYQHFKAKFVNERKPSLRKCVECGFVGKRSDNY